MPLPTSGATRSRSWFRALIAVSALLLIVTYFSYAFSGLGGLSRLLFWLGLGGENNVGAWWSGMLLALAAFLAFDGFFVPEKSPRERRGWLALGFALLLLSFDEVASLHEYLLGRGLAFLAVLGLLGLGLAGYGMAQLMRARVPARVLAGLSLAFGLLASVPLHELVQKMLEWRDPAFYGLRAVLEEGTEISAMLIFVAVTRANAASLLRTSRDFLMAPVQWRRLVLVIAVLLWAPLTTSTFFLPYPGGPADWLGATLLLMCALLAARAAVRSGDFSARSLGLILFYLAASTAANAVSLKWMPTVLGTPVSVRGIAFALLLVGAAVILRANRRHLMWNYALTGAAVFVGCALVWPTSQLVWCGLPSVFALWLYSIESQAAAAAQGATTPPIVSAEFAPAVRAAP